MTRQRRVTAMLLTVVFLVVMFFSAIYIIAEANHDCSGEDCAICREIYACENMLKAFRFVAVIAAVLSLFCDFVRAFSMNCGQQARTFSLVTLKVKLSD